MPLKNDPNKISAILLSDIDGVITDWFRGYRSYLSDYLGIESTGEMPTLFSMTDVYPDLKEPWAFIKEYQTSQAYTNLQLYGDVKRTLETLRDEGVEVHFVTSCGTDKETVRMRTEWLQYHLPGLYADVNFLGLGEDKTRVLAKFEQYTNYVPVIFIDDQAKMLSTAEQLGFHPVIKDMEYNQDDRDYERVSTYSELVDLIKLETLIHKTSNKHLIDC